MKKFLSNNVKIKDKDLKDYIDSRMRACSAVIKLHDEEFMPKTVQKISKTIFSLRKYKVKKILKDTGRCFFNIESHNNDTKLKDLSDKELYADFLSKCDIEDSKNVQAYLQEFANRISREYGSAYVNLEVSNKKTLDYGMADASKIVVFLKGTKTSTDLEYNKGRLAKYFDENPKELSHWIKMELLLSLSHEMRHWLQYQAFDLGFSENSYMNKLCKANLCQTFLLNLLQSNFISGKKEYADLICYDDYYSELSYELDARMFALGYIINLIKDNNDETAKKWLSSLKMANAPTRELLSISTVLLKIDYLTVKKLFEFYEVDISNDAFATSLTMSERDYDLVVRGFSEYQYKIKKDFNKLTKNIEDYYPYSLKDIDKMEF